MTETKLSQLKKAFDAGDLRGALRIAARFYDLGDDATAIKRAHECYHHPNFYIQLGHDPAELIELGRRAILRRWY